MIGCEQSSWGSHANFLFVARRPKNRHHTILATRRKINVLPASLVCIFLKMEMVVGFLVHSSCIGFFCPTAVNNLYLKLIWGMIQLPILPSPSEFAYNTKNCQNFDPLLEFCQGKRGHTLVLLLKVTAASMSSFPDPYFKWIGLGDLLPNKIGRKVSTPLFILTKHPCHWLFLSQQKCIRPLA